jgi:hypothetical protein
VTDPNRPLSWHPTTPTAADRILPTLTGAQIARVAAYGRRRAIARDEVLVDVGDKAVPFFALLRGELQVGAAVRWNRRRDRHTPSRSALWRGQPDRGMARLASAVGEDSIDVAFVHQGPPWLPPAAG